MGKSIKVAELIEALKKQPQDWDIYVSTDREGNGYGSLDAGDMVGGSDKDKVVVLYPMDIYEDMDIMPIETEEIYRAIRTEGEK